MIYCTIAKKLIEYRFGNYIGQIFHDYSGQFNDAVNGESSLTTTGDSFGTYMGIYIRYSPHRYITLPSNNIVQRPLSLPPPYSFMIWNLMHTNFCSTLFYRGIDANNYYKILANFPNVGLSITVVVNSVLYSSSNAAFLTCCNCNVYIVKWSLVSLTIQLNTFKLYVNGNLFITLTLSQNYIDPPGNNAMKIGYSVINQMDSVGMIWNFILMTGEPILTNYFSGSSTVCLTKPGCTLSSCPISIIDPDLGAGCINAGWCIPSLTCGWIPGAPTSTCPTTPCLSCACASKSCIVVNGAAVCLPTCDPGFFLNGTVCSPCSPVCTACSALTVCSGCVILNSKSDYDTGCLCNDGYYSPSGLIKSTDVCYKCYPECLTCSPLNICLTCVASNAIPHISVGCICDMNYNNFTSLTHSYACTQCGPDCSACNPKEICLSCVSANAKPNNPYGCKCLDGFYNTTTLSTVESCLVCNSECTTCNSSVGCVTCLANNSTPDVNGTCMCNSGYFNASAMNSSSACKACTQNCLKCTGEKFNECLKCNNILENGVCVADCAYGFANISKECKLNPTGSAFARFLFEELSGIYNDTISNISAFTITSPSTQASTSLPKPVYKRGIYFTGSSALEINQTNTRKLFTSSFTLSFWLNPSLNSATIFHKVSSSTILLLSLNSDILVVNLNISSSLSNISNSSFPLLQNSWSHILFSLSYTNVSTASISINSNTIFVSSVSALQYIDTYSSLFIGSDSNFTSDYIGFIFELQLFAYAVGASGLVSISCNGCPLCPVSQVCIPNCNITESYSDSSKSCFTCNPACTNGCISLSSCNLCADDECVQCSSFNVKSCTRCAHNFMVIEGVCSACDNTTYYDEPSSSCLPCKNLCITCLTQSVCTSCISNSYLADSKNCECEIGFSGDSTCERESFGLFVYVMADNSLMLSFSSPLEIPLNASSIEVIQNSKALEYVINIESLTNYIVVLTFTDDITNLTSNITLNVLLNLTSESNQLLKDYSFQLKLFESSAPSQAKAYQKQVKAAATLATQGSSVGLSAAFGTSLFNFDPTSIFNFMNTAEMYYSVHLFNNQINSILGEFLLGLRIQSKIPNIFSFFISLSSGVPLPAKYKSYGYKTNLLLLNSGVHFTVLLVFLLLALIVYCLNKVNSIRARLESITKMFKYSIFIRLWIQLYFELFTASIISIKYSRFENAPQIIDAIISSLIIIVDLVGIVVMILILIARKRLTITDRINDHVSKFGAFFDEFKTDFISQWLFYVLYIFRRLFIEFSYYFIEDGLLQLVILFTFSVTVSIYVLATRCFKVSLYNLYHVVNELLIAIFSFVLILGYLPENKTSQTTVNDLCMKIIMSAWAMNIICSFYLLINKLINKIRDFLQSRKKLNLKVFPTTEKTEP